MKRLLLILLIAALGTLVASAQDAPAPILAGESITGTLTSTMTEARYTLEGEAGTPVTITLASDDFDAYLLLLDSDESVITEDDDSGDGFDAAITIEIPADETYTIVATNLRAYNSNGVFSETGDYTLTVTITGRDEAPVTGTPIEYGATVDGAIGEDFEAVNYTFDATEGDIINARVESDEFDAYLLLYDPAGSVLIRDDDSGEDTNALIEEFTIPATGEYILSVESFGSVIGIEPESGAFTLTLEAEAFVVREDDVDDVEDEVDINELIEDTDMTFGDVVEGRLDSDFQNRAYTFTADAGDIVTITMTSDEFDTYLFLEDADGGEIALDDDGAGNLNSRIGPLEIPADGRYTIIADSFSNVVGDSPVTGAFTLTLERAEVIEGEIGTPITGVIDEETPVVVYGFDGEAGDVLTFTLETGWYATYIEITGGDIERQVYRDDRSSGPIVLPDDGTYFVIVTSFDLFEASDYTLTVNEVEPVAIDVNTEQMANFNDSEALVYTFEGRAGAVIDVIVDSGGRVDTRLLLTDPGGLPLAFDDDSGSGFDPELRGIILSGDGTYSVLVEPYIPGDNGDFTVNVRTGGGASLDAGPQVVRISDKQFANTLSFDGQAGETVRVGVRLLNGVEGEPLVIISQGGEELAYNRVGRVERLMLEFTVPEDGPVQIVVENPNAGGAILEFSLERPAQD
jgi:hypothetical protein